MVLEQWVVSNTEASKLCSHKNFCLPHLHHGNHILQEFLRKLHSSLICFSYILLIKYIHKCPPERDEPVMVREFYNEV